MSGKSYINALTVKFALATGKKVLVATSDQGRTIRELSKVLPGVLFELEGDTLIRPHLPRRKGVILRI